MRRQRRRFVTPVAVLIALFGVGAASAQAAARVSANDDKELVVASSEVPAGMELIASYEGEEQWQGPRVELPNQAYQAVVSYKCDKNGFLYVSWDGEPYSYETAHSSDAKGTVTLDGHEGGTRGYFSVDTWLGCSWSMKVYS
ncbi:hypothetical protein [Actinoplanes sp. NPDC051494]|uniref:hypothetical protein n=1 Tax=Actinoplanes sp. NPDC051494 TaxID=3363907 RepID=UPI0037979F49